MKARFIEDADLKIGLAFTAETDEERLLLRAFSAQAGEHRNLMALRGWGAGGPGPGYREIRLYLAGGTERAPGEDQATTLSDTQMVP